MILYTIISMWIILTFAFVASKQKALETGTPILLETVPVDPRDLLRGDYVTLRYKISSLKLDKINSEKKYYNYGSIVYVRLEPKEKFWEATAVSTKKNKDKSLYLKGKSSNCWNKTLHVNYCIENYFVPEGEGKEIEKNMQGTKSTIAVEAVVDNDGNAIIKRLFVGEKPIKEKTY